MNRIREVIPDDREINASKVSNILDSAVRLQRDNPDGSILKYAANSIVRKLNDSSAVEFTKYVIKLCFHYPVLIPTLKNSLSRVYKTRTGAFNKEFLFLLKDSISYGRSDAACWLLYYLKVFHNDVTDKIADKIVEWGDCMALTLLAEFSAHENKVIKFAKQLNKNDLYELDAYWLLLYQLYFKGKIINLYNDTTFNILKKHSVTFVNI